MDETEKPTRGQGDNWKISNSWMSLSSLVWRDNGKRRRWVPEPRDRGHLKYKDRKEGEKYPSISNLLPGSPIGQTQLSVSDRLPAPWCRTGEVGGM